MATISRQVLTGVREMCSALDDATPANVVQLVRYAPAMVFHNGRMQIVHDGLGITPSELPPNIPAMLLPGRRTILISRQYLSDIPDEVLSALEFSPIGLGPSWQRHVERSTMLRFLVACCWIRWYRWSELTALALNCHPETVLAHPMMRTRAWHPLSPTGVGFRPLVATTWQEYHARYYTRFWLMLSQLLCNMQTMEVQIARYLALPPEQIAPRGPALRAQVEQCTVSLGLAPHQSWDRFTRYLAEQNRVPEVIVRSRLDGDRPIRSYRDYCGMNRELLADLPVLAQRRHALAQRRRLQPETLGLWLAEPIAQLGDEMAEATSA